MTEEKDDKISLNSYGRKTWDTKKYASEARERYQKHTESTIPKQKLEIPEVTKSTDLQKERAKALDAIDNLSTYSLVPGGINLATKKGRGAGFYCSVCDLTYKDNLQYVDHLNSKQHLGNAGLSDEIKPATLQEVQDRLEYLKRKLDSKTDEQYDIRKRIEMKRKFDENRERKKRERKRSFKQKLKNKNGETIDKDNETKTLMGFGDFGSTKK